MRKYLILYALLTTALLVWGVRHYRREQNRLLQNQTALATQITHYRTRCESEVAQTQVLRLRCHEFEELRQADAAQIKALGIRLKRVEATAKSHLATSAQIATPLRDTVFINRHESELILDSVRHFRWRDPWITIEGHLAPDSLFCRIESVDTLRQIIHRVPRRFLFFRWGTKAIRQEIFSSNPHTRILFSEYVQFEK